MACSRRPDGRVAFCFLAQGAISEANCTGCIDRGSIRPVVEGRLAVECGFMGVMLTWREQKRIRRKYYAVRKWYYDAQNSQRGVFREILNERPAIRQQVASPHLRDDGIVRADHPGPCRFTDAGCRKLNYTEYLRAYRLPHLDDIVMMPSSALRSLRPHHTANSRPSTA